MNGISYEVVQKPCKHSHCSCLLWAFVPEQAAQELISVLAAFMQTDSCADTTCSTGSPSPRALVGALTAFMPGAQSLLCKSRQLQKEWRPCPDIQASRSLQREELFMMSGCFRGKKVSCKHPDQVESVGVLLMFHEW